MSIKQNKRILIAASALWLSMVAVGLGVLWNYANTPGTAAAAPQVWPANSHIQRATDRATLVMLAHPHCPCTRASVGELARLMAQAQGRVMAYVLFAKPANLSKEWEQTDLRATAAAIPGVYVMPDDDGVEARRFNAATSGQTMLYDREGNLLFSGGITGGRGHEGDNMGRSAIVSFLTTGGTEDRETAVFGCELFAQGECQIGKEGGHAQHRK